MKKEELKKEEWVKRAYRETMELYNQMCDPAFMFHINETVAIVERWRKSAEKHRIRINIERDQDGSTT
jgi:hypothetical protein